jgi:hypothetical protein
LKSLPERRRATGVELLCGFWAFSPNNSRFGAN